MEKVAISGDYIKLASFLKFVGIAETGGHAKEMVQNGEVVVDNEVCVMRGKKLRDGTVVVVGDEEFEVCTDCT